MEPKGLLKRMIGMETIERDIEVCARMSDEELWAAVPRLAQNERGNVVRLLIHLGEVHRRDLHLKRAYSGLFRYLRALGFSEWESRARAIAAVAARKYRRILSMMSRGALDLSAVATVGPYLTPENHRALLEKASRRSARELKALVAGLDPKAGRRDVVRVVSAPDPLPGVPAAARTSSPAAVLVEGLFSELALPGLSDSKTAASCRLRYHFDADAGLDALLGRARDLLRHKYPRGEMEYILNDALNALLEKVDPDRRIKRSMVRADRASRAGQISRSMLQ